MEQLIEVVNKLQDTFSALNISCPFDLPQIAVVGEQSAGKSSVLENFVGKDFLPRGAGIVTRRPLILQLIYNKSIEYAEFVHQKGRKYTDFLEVRREIEAETNRVAGDSKNVSSIPINLRVYSPNVLNLTLIDLPGLTKVAVGDQPVDIDRQIRDMVLQFISNPNCLILAVTQATIDLANSDSLNLAKQVDPDSQRTIGVITKIDMMQDGTDCVAALTNSLYPLKRGYVGIVNRSQRDIKANKDIISAQEDELKFFQSHPQYCGMIDRLGSRYLQKTLNEQLSQHIKQTLPQLRQSVLDELEKLNHKMDSNRQLYEDLDDETVASKVLMVKLQEYSRKLDSILGYQNESVDLDAPSIGSKINLLLGERFFNEINQIQYCPDLVKRDIKIAILNTQGVSQTIFSASAPFLAVIKSHINSTQSACLKILDLVTDEIRTLVSTSANETFGMYPTLCNEVVGFTQEKIEHYYRNAKDRIHFFLLLQSEHINTNHPDFLAAQSSSNPGLVKQGMVTAVENIIHKQGMVNITTGTFKGQKQYYLLLRGQTLIIYKDAAKKEFKENLILNSCKVVAVRTKDKYKQIFVYNKDSQPLSKTYKTLEFQCDDQEEMESWYQAFIGAGLETESPDDAADQQILEHDLELKKNIEYIYLLVDSYFKITIKVEQDTVAKIIVFCIIIALRNTILTDLVVHVYSLGDFKSLMSESAEAVAERDKTLKMHRSCKEALSIIDDNISLLGSSKGFSSKFSLKSPARNVEAPKSNNPPARPSRGQELAKSADNVQRAVSPNPSLNSIPSSSQSSHNVVPARRKPQKPPPSRSGSKPNSQFY